MPDTASVVPVVAALIWDGERFFACQRPAHKARPLHWEFPGGKVEPGESHAQALKRECREELGCAVAVTVASPVSCPEAGLKVIFKAYVVTS